MSMPIKENPLSRLAPRKHTLSRISLSQFFPRRNDSKDETETTAQDFTNGNSEDTKSRPRIIKAPSPYVTIFSKDETIPSHQPQKVYRPQRKPQTT